MGCKKRAAAASESECFAGCSMIDELMQGKLEGTGKAPVSASRPVYSTLLEND